MSDEAWTRISKETVFSCPYYRLSHDRYRLPGGDAADYHYIDIPGSTMVVPMLPGGDLVLVGQYRYLIGRHSLEFPAGGMKEGFEARFNAAQELREEAGYEAARWQKIGEFAPYNGVSNEMCHVFLARDLTSVAPEPEPTEEFRIVPLSPDAIREKIDAGELWDGMTIASFRFFESWWRDHGAAS
jgi:ADP-ribose pyrophosphatase